MHAGENVHGEQKSGFFAFFVSGVFCKVQFLMSVSAILGEIRRINVPEKNTAPLCRCSEPHVPPREKRAKVRHQMGEKGPTSSGRAFKENRRDMHKAKS